MVGQVSDAPRTRRALLAAAAAAGAATVASAVVKPLSVRGAVDDNADMFVGTVYGDVSTTTGLVNHTTGTTVFSANSGFGTAVLGTSSSGSGGAGVSGVTNAAGASGIGVRGTGGTGRGVVGESTSYIGVSATSGSGVALQAVSTSGIGVHASSFSGPGLIASSSSSYGAVIFATGTNPAVHAYGSGGGVHGHASSEEPETTAPNTGVQGTAEGTGTGGFFSSPSGNALRVQGKASFSRSGRVNVPAGRSYVDISVSGGLASSAAVVATLQMPRGTACVTSVRINYPSAGKARIYLNKVASTTATTPVGFFVLG